MPPTRSPNSNGCWPCTCSSSSPASHPTLIVISPAIVAQLEPILLREPVNQPEKWLAKPQGSANQAFLEALRNFMYWENYDVRVRMDGKIDQVVLADILSKHP